jgi:hypothetical protein
MRVLMAFQGGMAIDPYFEIAKLDRQIVSAVEKHLASDPPKDRAIFLIREDFHAFPAVAFVG